MREKIDRFYRSLDRPLRFRSRIVLGLLVILEGSGLLMLIFRHRVLDGPWFGGLPLSAAVQLYLLFLGPLLLVALAYALTFERFGIRERDLERLNEVRTQTEDRH